MSLGWQRMSQPVCKWKYVHTLRCESLKSKPKRHVGPWFVWCRCLCRHSRKWISIGALGSNAKQNAPFLFVHDSNEEKKGSLHTQENWQADNSRNLSGTSLTWQSICAWSDTHPVHEGDGVLEEEDGRHHHGNTLHGVAHTEGDRGNAQIQDHVWGLQVDGIHGCSYVWVSGLANKDNVHKVRGLLVVRKRLSEAHTNQVTT